MSRMVFLCLILVSGIGVAAQGRSFSSTQELAQSIDTRYRDPLSKIRAAYSWVTSNIRYDVRNTFALNNSIHPRDKIDVAFKNRRGVCENFAAIFTDVCQKMGFQAVVIDGFTNPDIDRDNYGHSWAAVFINDDWYLFDPTWDNGATGEYRYFQKTGAEFIETHIPFDPMWQMLSQPRVAGTKLGSAYFNYKDSIQNFLTADSLTRFEGAARRIEKDGPKSKLAGTNLSVLKTNLEIKRQEEQMAWYDKAVELLNEVTHRLNHFIDLRNQQFSGVVNEQELARTLDGINDMLDSSDVFLGRVDQSKATLVYGTQPAREKLDNLRRKSRDQQRFLTQYLTTSIAERNKLFQQ